MVVRGARRQAQAQEETTTLQVSPQSHRPVVALKCQPAVGGREVREVRGEVRGER